MNIYEVVSETLYLAGAYMEPDEPYCIAQLVAARNPSQARYIAWNSDRETFCYDLLEMPRFSVHIRLKNQEIPSGIVTEDKRFQYLWRDEK